LELFLCWESFDKGQNISVTTRLPRQDDRAKLKRAFVVFDGRRDRLAATLRGW
jgi:hypothetical protein